jgi:hypothetical protein
MAEMIPERPVRQGDAVSRDDGPGDTTGDANAPIREGEPPEDAQKYPDLFEAATTGPASFRHMVEARSLLQQPAHESDPAVAVWLLPRIKRNFEATEVDDNLRDGVNMLYRVPESWSMNKRRKP